MCIPPCRHSSGLWGGGSFYMPCICFSNDYYDEVLGQWRHKRKFITQYKRRRSSWQLSGCYETDGRSSVVVAFYRVGFIDFPIHRVKSSDSTSSQSPNPFAVAPLRTHFTLDTTRRRAATWEPPRRLPTKHDVKVSSGWMYVGARKLLWCSVGFLPRFLYPTWVTGYADQN